jgi:hypothetical protein
MKVSILLTSSLLVAAGAAAVGASTTIDLDGNNRVLSGSDILVPVAKQLLANTPLAVPGPTAPDSSGNSGDGTYYVGGGQSVGDAAIGKNTQQISVGTASLKNSNFCKNSVTGASLGSVGWINADGDTSTSGTNTGAGAAGQELDIQGTTEALLIGLDGLSIYAHGVQGAGPNSLAVQGKSLIVHHYISDPTKARTIAEAAGDKVVLVAGTSKTWTFASGAFSQRDVATKVTITGAAVAANNGTFTISSVPSGTTFTTVELTGASETFAGGVAAVVSSPFYVVDPTTDPTTGYGAVTNNGDHTFTYVFNNSLDAIRLLYGGLHHGNSTNPAAPDGPNNTIAGELGTFDAGSDVRRSLADNFGALFQGAVPNGGAKLSRVWRRSDLAGATNAFVALVNFGARGIGALTGTSTKTNPFANSGDANGRNAISGAVVSGQVNSVVKSNGGPGDFADWDPIRRPALIGPNPATTSTTAVDLEQVAENDGTLGLVQTVFPPDTAGVSLTQQYPTRLCTAGAFDLIAPGFTPTGANGNNPCPQGGPFSGLCYQPYQRDTSTNPATKHYSCLAKSTNPPAFAAPSPSDDRVFNLGVRDDVTGGYIKDLNQRFLAKSGFYRIHTTLSNALVSPATTPASVVTAKQATADFQAGSLIVADPFSVHFGGRGLDTAPGFGSFIFATSAAGPAPAFDPTHAVTPTDAHIKNLVLPTGPNPNQHVLDDGYVYVLARRLYVNSLVGFKARGPVDATHPSGTFTAAADGGDPIWGLAGEELAYARAWQVSDHVGASLLNNGLVPLPSAADGYAPNGVSALDYPEDGAVSSPNLTTIPLNGCGQAAGQNRDATVASPPDSITPYSLSGSAPPFPSWP